MKYPLFAVMSSADGAVRREVGRTNKYEGNPLWQQDRPWEPRIDNGYPNVIYDVSDPLGTWRMWYGASLWEYAFSDDGIEWTKPDLGMFDLGNFDKTWEKYGKHNNVIMYGNGMGIYKDLHEVDPSRRFKAFGGPSCFFGRGGGADNCTGPVQGTAVSPDGLWWYDARNVSWPYKAGSETGPHQKYDTHQNIFWDAAKDKYVATTRDLEPFPWRSVAIAESYSDEFAFNTTDAPPSVVQGTASEQPYSQITFPYYGIYLGLSSVYDADASEGRVHLRLTYSLDAETWHWVDKGGLTGQDFIALGRDSNESATDGNAFDSHIIFAAAYPIRMDKDDNVRIYYMGGNGPHSGARNSSFALATMRPDGFVAITGSGTIVTIKMRCTASRLIFSADILDDGGSVRVGVVGVEGLSTDDAVPLTQNATNEAVTFRSGKTLEALVGGEISLEFVLERASVFTFGFTKSEV